MYNTGRPAVPAILIEYQDQWPASSAQLTTQPIVKIGGLPAGPPPVRGWTNDYGWVELATLAPLNLQQILMIEIEDWAANRTHLVPMTPGRVTLPWDRPIPFARFDGQGFGNPQSFQRYCCERYSYLSSIRPTPLRICTLYCGSPASVPELEWVALQFRPLLGEGRSSDPRKGKELDELGRKAPQKIYDAVARAAGLTVRSDIKAGYLEVLRKLALGGTSARAIADALFKGLGVPLRFRSNERVEDGCALSMLVFVAGAMAYGYTKGRGVSINNTDDGSWELGFQIETS